MNDVHQIKTGFDSKKHKISNFSGGAIGGGPFGNTSDASWIMYEFEPEESSFYIQDKMEYKEFIINVGVRYDALDPNSRYPDPSRKLLYQYDNQAYEPSDLSQLSEQQVQQADWVMLLLMKMEFLVLMEMEIIFLSQLNGLATRKNGVQE